MNMQTYIIEDKFIRDYKELIEFNIKTLVGIFENALYFEQRILDIFIAKEIVLKAILCAYKSIYENATEKDIHECIFASDLNNINLADNVPDEQVVSLYNYVQNAQKNTYEVFEVSSIKSGRFNLLLKGVIFNLKLLYIEYLKMIDSSLYTSTELKKFYDLGALSVPTFKKTFEFKYHQIINHSIVFTKCYESSENDYKMCREILHINHRNESNYLYRLSDEVDTQLKQEIDLFINTYTNKPTDENTKPEHKKEILKNSLDLVQEKLQTYMTDYSNNKEIKQLQNEYKNLFKTIENKLKNHPRKIPHFLRQLKKVNMNYTMNYNHRIIYPFLVDILFFSFGFSRHQILYKEKTQSKQDFAKTISEHNFLYIDKGSDSDYLHKQFIETVSLVPEEYLSRNPHIFILKHYSQILQCNYNSLASLIRQLKFDKPDYYKTEFYLSDYLQNKKLEIDDDYFRELSLYVI